MARRPCRRFTQREADRFVEVERVQAEGLVVARTDGNVGVETQRGWHDESFVVVGVLADEVYSAGSAENLWYIVEMLAVGIGNKMSCAARGYRDIAFGHRVVKRGLSPSRLFILSMSTVEIPLQSRGTRRVTALLSRYVQE